MDDKIIGLYAAGLTVRDIQAHLLDLYGLKVSPDLISRVTDVLGEVLLCPLETGSFRAGVFG